MSAPERRPELPVGSTVDRGFALLRRQPRPLLLPPLLLHLVALVVTAVVVGGGVLLLGDVTTRSELVRQSTFFGDSTLETQQVPVLSDGQIVLVVILGVIALLTTVWFSLAAYASVVLAARRVLEGEPALALRPALRQALGAAPRLFGLSLMVGVIALVGFGVGLGVLVLIGELVSVALAVLAGLLMFLGVLYVGTRLLLWPFVVLNEDVGVAAFGRSWTLTAGRFWPLFGLVLLLGVVVGAVYLVATLLSEVALGGLNALDGTTGAVALIPYTGFSLLLSVIVMVAFLVPMAIAYRTLAGEDGDATSGAGPAGPVVGGSPAVGVPAGDGVSTGWDAAEPGIWADGPTAPRGTD